MWTEVMSDDELLFTSEDVQVIKDQLAKDDPWYDDIMFDIDILEKDIHSRSAQYELDILLN